MSRLVEARGGVISAGNLAPTSAARRGWGAKRGGPTHLTRGAAAGNLTILPAHFRRRRVAPGRRMPRGDIGAHVTRRHQTAPRGDIRPRTGTLRERNHRQIEYPPPLSFVFWSNSERNRSQMACLMPVSFIFSARPSNSRKKRMVDDLSTMRFFRISRPRHRNACENIYLGRRPRSCGESRGLTADVAPGPRHHALMVRGRDPGPPRSPSFPASQAGLPPLGPRVRARPFGVPATCVRAPAQPPGR